MEFIDIRNLGRDGDLGAGGVTYAFSAPTGSTVGSTLTETITAGNRTATITFTETAAAGAGSLAVYQILAPGASAPSTGTGTTGSTAPTFTFAENANGTGNVIETIATANATETLTFAGGTTLTDDLITISAPSTAYGSHGTLSYNFTPSGSATTMTETVSRGSISETVTLTTNPTATFAATTLGGNAAETVTHIEGNEVVTRTYVQEAPGSYALASTERSFVPQGSATTALDVRAFDRADIVIGASGATITPISTQGKAGTSFTAPSNDSFAVVAPATLPAGLPAGGVFIEETRNVGTHSAQVLYYSATGASGVFSEIAHGSSIDVTGVAAQLAQLPSSLVALL